MMKQNDDNYMLDAAIIPIGGNKRIYDERVPFAKINNIPLIESTLEAVVNSNVNMVFIPTDNTEKMNLIVDKMINKGTITKPVYVLPGKNTLGENILYSVIEYTKVCWDLEPYKGDWKSSGDFKEYVENNPSCRNKKMLAVSGDIPFAQTKNINEFISRYLNRHYNHGIEASVLFTKKEVFCSFLNEVLNSTDEFAKDDFAKETTLLNYFDISNKKIRVANAYAFMPFQAKRIAYDLLHDIHSARLLAKSKNRMSTFAGILKKYAHDREILLSIPGILSQLALIFYSFENPKKEKSKLKNFIATFSDGGSKEKLCKYAEKMIGLKSYIDYKGTADMVFDIDDEFSYNFAKKCYPAIKESLKR